MSNQAFESDRIQRDARALAHYLQTVHDLSVTPLFAEGHPNPRVGVTYDSNGVLETITFSVPDPFVLRAALIPFRKLWGGSEPSQYTKTSKLLGKYNEHERWYVKFLAECYKKSVYNTSEWKVAFRPENRFNGQPLPAGDVINLWLNSRLFHSGAKGREGNCSHAEFVRERDRIGPARFEYLFNAAVYYVGMQSTNLMDLAEYTLEKFHNEYPEIEFELDEISKPGLERFGDGTTIRRFSPGVTPNPRTDGERLAVLRRENAFNSLDRAFAFLSDDNELLAHHILREPDFESFLVSFEMKLVARIPSFSAQANECPDDATDLQDDPQVNVGATGLARNGTEFWTSNITALNKELQLAKEHLVSRQGWIPGPHRIWERALASHGMSVRFPYTHRTQTRNYNEVS